MTHNEMQMQRIAELKTEAATLLSERDAAEAQLAARDKRIAELEAACAGELSRTFDAVLATPKAGDVVDEG